MVLVARFSEKLGAQDKAASIQDVRDTTTTLTRIAQTRPQCAHCFVSCRGLRQKVVVGGSRENGSVFVVLSASPSGVRIDELDESGEHAAESRTVTRAALPGVVTKLESRHPRWVWDDTTTWYPPLLRTGVRVRRSHDLRLCHAILRNSLLTASSTIATAAPSVWDAALQPSTREAGPIALFDSLDMLDGAVLDDVPDAGDLTGVAPVGTDVALVEFAAQRAAIEVADQPGRIRLLLAAESAGALAAAEMSHDGLPWSTAIHDQVLTRLLGPRPTDESRPSVLEGLAVSVRAALDAPELNPDSATELLRALRRVGLNVTTTRKEELARLDHPVVAPLLEYKKLSRLLSANGWAWMDAWIRDGRFHPDYVPGGVVTGRWATRGGGALQLPRQVRGAVVADDGWKLVVADAAQLEPRILAALAEDSAMASAGRGTDLYQGLVDRGVVDTRAHAKVAMLGAMYGATSGEAGRLMPRLARAYPRAVGLVENAARAGEQGRRVVTRLGRTSPLPGESWLQAQASAAAEDAGEAERARARSRAREWGRFTRNFVVQGTAAEWALCWMADLRGRLRALGASDRRPHLVFFLHDEVMVHAPAELADEVRSAVLEAAAAAGRLLFGDFPVDFAVTVAIVNSYADAK